MFDNVEIAKKLLTLYAAGTRVPAHLCLPLAQELHTRAQDRAPEERAATGELVRRANAVDDIILARERRASHMQENRFTFARAWGSGYSILRGISLQPEDLSGDRAEQASSLLHEIYPQGTGFVKLDAKSAYSAGHRALRHVEQQGLRARFVELAGEATVLAIERATRELGAAIGTGPTVRDEPETNELVDATRAFTDALGHYCRILAARVNLRAEASVRDYIAAVAPIEAYRVTRNRMADDDVADDPSTDDVVVEPNVENPVPDAPVEPPIA